ncbi:MAG: adenylate/guanylate cyclase domain-containing protein [Elusimicrobia bacterium]|nr:adenylate/guanylate cyclase domain-containing protein [Elusimicrobiota bacterium]
MAQPVTRNLVILLTDIKGFTDRTSHQSRAEMQQLLDRHKEIVLPVLQGRGGTLVKTMGDAFLMTFESPTNAVLAGIDVQAALRSYNEGKPAEERIDVRIAINQGEVNLADDDVFGEAVNITARIEAVADAGDVFFTGRYSTCWSPRTQVGPTCSTSRINWISPGMRRQRRRSPRSRRRARSRCAAATSWRRSNAAVGPWT